jgi:hypothetical protein
MDNTDAHGYIIMELSVFIRVIRGLFGFQHEIRI